MTYHVTCNTDENYLQHCCAMLCSLFENNRDIHFHVHLLTHGLQHERISFLNGLCSRYQNELSVYNVDESKLDGVKFRENRPLTKAAYYRVLLPEILSTEIDKILYLDCDIIVLGSVKDLYNIELNGLALAACQDASPYNNLHRIQLGLDLKGKAFCSGIMVINLEYWKETEAEEQLLEISKRERGKIYLHDQDALNYVFKGRWYVLPYKWNISPLSIAVLDNSQKGFDHFEYAFDPRVLHFASPAKPWFNVWTPQQKYYLKYLNLSGFPNPKMKDVDLAFKLNTYKNVLRYYINRYIHPLVPDIVEILFKDILNLFKLLLSILKGPKRLNNFLFRRWLEKYGQ